MNVPKLRFPEFEDEWKYKKIGDLAEIVRGASPRPIQDPKWFDSESEVGWLRISDVTKQNGRIHYLEQRISKAGQEKTRILNEPHLLLSIAATVGKPVINYVKTGVHDGFLIFLNPKFHQEFMFQWLEMFRPSWQKYGQPGSQVNLNSELVRTHQLLIPELTEQERIAEFFMVLDKKIQLQQEKIYLLKKQKKGYMQNRFTYDSNSKEHSLQDLVSNISAGKSKALMEVDLKYPTLGSTGIIGYANTYDYVGDFILVARVGANAGKVTTFEGKCNITDNTIFFECKNILKEVLIEYLLLKDLNKTAFGSGQPLIKASELKTIQVKLPPLNEQKEIQQASILFSKKINLEQNKLNYLLQQKQAFMQQMFI